MGFVEVVRRADDDRIERRVAQQVLDVVERVLHPETVGEGARLRQVAVADGLHLDALELLQHRQVGHLRDGATAQDPDLETLVSRPARRHSGSSLVEALEHGARVVRGEDALVILSGPRAADRAPLAEAYAVTGPSAVDREPSDSSPGA